MPVPTIILVCGPTASGKTALAVDLARLLDTVIISADSRQCFRELTIGVAKPSREQLAAVAHYFIDSHSVNEPVNAAVFESLALGWAADIFSRRPVAVLAGGTGLYINAFCDGLDAVPPADPGVRNELRAGYAREGLTWLQQTIRQSDPLFAAQGEMQNPHRLIRALEVVRGTGRSILSFHQGEKAPRAFRVLRFGLALPRAELTARIDARTGRMLAAGLLEEVRGLAPSRHLPALQTVGYTELFEVLEGKKSLAAGIAAMQAHTRQYAKRQMTWFGRDPRIRWLDAMADPLEELRVCLAAEDIRI